MKVFLSSDMEGTAGIVDWQQCAGDGPEAVAGRRLRFHGEDPLAVYRSFCAAILLTRTIAEAV
jgi:hypothetical protein